MFVYYTYYIYIHTYTRSVRHPPSFPFPPTQPKPPYDRCVVPFHHWTPLFFVATATAFLPHAKAVPDEPKQRPWGEKTHGEFVTWHGVPANRSETAWGRQRRCRQRRLRRRMSWTSHLLQNQYLPHGQKKTGTPTLSPPIRTVSCRHLRERQLENSWVFVHLKRKKTLKRNHPVQVIQSDLFGDFKWPFQGLSDLHLGYQKVTWKKLGDIFFRIQHLSSKLFYRASKLAKWGVKIPLTKRASGKPFSPSDLGANETQGLEVMVGWWS